MSEVAEESPIPAKSARTRSGRVIRPPRHIEKVSNLTHTKISN